MVSCPLHPVHRVNLVNPAPIFRIRFSLIQKLLSYPVNLVFLSHGNGSVSEILIERLANN